MVITFLEHDPHVRDFITLLMPSLASSPNASMLCPDPAQSEACTSDQGRGGLLANCSVLSDAQVGKKKAVDVQFYTEVMESVQTIDAGRRSMYDPDELEEEQRERDTKNRVRLMSCFPIISLEKFSSIYGLGMSVLTSSNVI